MKKSLLTKAYPLQSKVHECVSTRDLSFQSVESFSDVHSAQKKDS